MWERGSPGEIHRPFWVKIIQPNGRWCFPPGTGYMVRMVLGYAVREVVRVTALTDPPHEAAIVSAWLSQAPRPRSTMGPAAPATTTVWRQAGPGPASRAGYRGGGRHPGRGGIACGPPPIPPAPAATAAIRHRAADPRPRPRHPPAQAPGPHANVVHSSAIYFTDPSGQRALPGLARRRGSDQTPRGLRHQEPDRVRRSRPDGRLVPRHRPARPQPGRVRPASRGRGRQAADRDAGAGEHHLLVDSPRRSGRGGHHDPGRRRRHGWGAALGFRSAPGRWSRNRPGERQYQRRDELGATPGGGCYVWRSGIGITRDDRVIFAYGAALCVRTWPACSGGPAPSKPCSPASTRTGCRSCTATRGRPITPARDRWPRQCWLAGSRRRRRGPPPRFPDPAGEPGPVPGTARGAGCG